MIYALGRATAPLQTPMPIYCKDVYTGLVAIVSHRLPNTHAISDAVNNEWDKEHGLI